MRKVFPGFYTPTEAEFQTLWNEGLFVFDTNVLLDLYRYSDDTVNHLITIMEKIQGRIWIPYRVAFEYHRRLNDIIKVQATAYSDTIKALNDFNNKFKAKRSHPFLKNELHNEIEAFCKKFDHELIEKQKLIKKLITENPIKEKLADIIQDHIGEPFNEDELKTIYAEGVARYGSKQPPGYKDIGEKQGNEVYGDLIIWKEIIKCINEKGVPIIFVTGDVKEDWFQVVMGMTVGPRPELIDELRKEKDVLFYMYTTDSFLKFAQKMLKIEVKEETLAEVREIIKESQRTSLTEDTQDSSSFDDSIDQNVGDENIRSQADESLNDSTEADESSDG